MSGWDYLRLIGLILALLAFIGLCIGFIARQR